MSVAKPKAKTTRTAVYDPNLDMRGICAEWGRSRSSVLRDIEAGRLPKPFKIGGKGYLKLSQVEEARERLVANS